MADTAIEIRGLKKAYRSFTLGPLDLSVPAGVIYGFAGPNGAGKTTTIDLMLGMGAKDGGTVRVLGLDHLRDEAAVKARVGYVSPDLDFRAWMRVGRVIRFIRGFHPTWDDAYCASLMDRFAISPKDYTMHLSFGARIKLALVLALAWRPSVLVLDEPTSGLDAIARRELFGELLAAVAEARRTVFISSHALTDLERFADYVGLIRNGRLLFEGPTSTIVDRFRMVDLIVSPTAGFSEGPGVFVQSRHEDRWRALVDREVAPLETIARRGATPIAEAAVTLEEVSVALGR